MVPGEDVTVVNVCRDDDTKSAQSTLAVKYDNILGVCV